MSVSILPKSNDVEEATFVDIVDFACITYSGEVFQMADRRFFDVLDLIRQLASHEATAPVSLFLGWDLCHLCEDSSEHGLVRTRCLMHANGTEWIGTISTRGMLVELHGNTIYVDYGKSRID
ncbi:unnamed protein product [Rhizoctonia solani]|uniref:Uncharacterized protein n=1 Tax=Rhizoctonia solani TaxID=456999 RepID=A0A8H3BE05_9AGAM|nr:unnamed protein product [Rhizoctonia solani]